MVINLLKFQKTVKNEKRRGRGSSSQAGGTSCRGHKGQKARSGYRIIPAFEGGQTPLNRKLPKYGFKSLKIKYHSFISLKHFTNLFINDLSKIFDQDLFNRKYKNIQLKVCGADLSNNFLLNKDIILLNKNITFSSSLMKKINN
jgi:large subunit ribosomal protein L15